MVLRFGRRRRKDPQEPKEELPPSESEPEDAPKLSESPQTAEANAASEPTQAEADESPVAAPEPVATEATSEPPEGEASESPVSAGELVVPEATSEPTQAETDESPVAAQEPVATEATHRRRGASNQKESAQTEEGAPSSSPMLRTNGDTLSLMNSLLRLHEAGDVASLSDAADQLARTHLNGTHLLALLADKGGSFHLRAVKSGATGTLVKRLSEALGIDVSVELPPPHRGRMAKIWLDESVSSQSVSLADFWGSTAGEETCWRAEKALSITQISAFRLASPEEPLGIALFISLGDPPDPAMLDAIGHHLTAALTNLRSIEKARQFGTVDPVRWIPDRNEFAHQLSVEVSRARRYGHPVSLVLLVVDNFDTMRLEYGWTVANRLLRSVSSALAGQLRESDYLGSYRHNGFGAILVQTTGEAALEAAGRLREAAQGVRVLEGEDCPVPECVVASASSPEDGGDVSTLTLAAESRLLPKRRLSSASA
jgi:diguanylate cyclase (GGDEF)-like protein